MHVSYCLSQYTETIYFCRHNTWSCSFWPHSHASISNIIKIHIPVCELLETYMNSHFTFVWICNNGCEYDVNRLTNEKVFRGKQKFKCKLLTTSEALPRLRKIRLTKNNLKNVVSFSKAGLVLIKVLDCKKMFQWSLLYGYS